MLAERNMDPTLRTDVVIIGAGPTGLSLATQFVRHGVEFVIVEKNKGVTPFSKAIGVQARTLEIYEQIDLAQKAVEEGTIAGKARLLAGGEMRAELDLSDIGKGLSAYPYLLLLEQSKNEQLLYDYLQQRGKEVLWDTELKGFTQTGARVNAQFGSGGSPLTIAAKFLVGCDGTKSLVRRTLGFEFPGSTVKRMFFVADVKVDWKFSHDALHVCLSKDALLAFFPLKGDKRYRIVGSFPEEFAKDEGEVLYDEIEQQIREDAKLELDIHDVDWFSTYKVHTRHVNKFSEGRCFLAGDSAHIHTPAGGQGMNTGIQDGYNLAWKLALALRGKADEKLLDSYNEERLENAKILTQSTDRAFQFLASSEWFLAFLRTNVLPSIAKYMLSLDAVRSFVFPVISQIGINYRHGSLSQHAGDENFTVKAGDRMPYFLIDGASVYDRLREARAHFVVFSTDGNEHQQLRAEVESRFAPFVDFHEIALQYAGGAFGVDRPFSVFLRPDNYIGFLSTEISLKAVDSYLNNFLGFGQ
ncbi:MAG TPA: FAD-dependent monooxygenase [Pyrinomonadaceae bacterium]|nr:FAD-dependent monooxygenase [Pyrinomonadaceae bacterium]